MHYTSKFFNSFSKNIYFDLDKKFKLNKKKEIILPLGNCFLDIFTKELNNNKYNICKNKFDKIGKNGLEFFFGNFYNPLNLLHTLERIKKKKTLGNNSFTFSKQFGHFICLFTKARFKTNNLEKLKKKIIEIDKNLLTQIKKATVILLSFETNEIWLDKKTNKAWYTFYGNIYNHKSFNNKAKLKILTNDDLKKTMISIIRILKKFGNKKIILMTSPNHIAMTSQNLDVKIADNISKSSYSSVFNELEKIKDVKYFPCYEIFLRDTQKKIKKYRNDQLHVSNKFTNTVILKYFKKSFF